MSDDGDPTPGLHRRGDNDPPDDYDLWLEVLMQEPGFREAYDDAQRREQARRDAIRREANNVTKQPASEPRRTLRGYIWRERWVITAALLTLITVSWGSSFLLVELGAPAYARFLIGGAIGFLLYRFLYPILERRLRRWQ